MEHCDQCLFLPLFFRQAITDALASIPSALLSLSSGSVPEENVFTGHKSVKPQGLSTPSSALAAFVRKHSARQPFVCCRSTSSLLEGACSLSLAVCAFHYRAAPDERAFASKLHKLLFFIALLMGAAPTLAWRASSLQFFPFPKLCSFYDFFFSQLLNSPSPLQPAGGSGQRHAGWVGWGVLRNAG